MSKTSLFLAIVFAWAWYGVIAPYILLLSFNALFPAVAIVYSVKTAMILAAVAFVLTVKITVKYE